MADKPVLFELEQDTAEVVPDVANAPPVPDLDEHPRLATPPLVRFVSRPRSRLVMLFWTALVALVGAIVSIAAWDFAMAMLARFPPLGWALSAGFAVLIFSAFVLSLRELTALRRLRRVDDLRARLTSAEDDLSAARGAVAELKALYASRADMAWGLGRLNERESEVFDADALFQLAEEDLMAPLDALALAEVQAAARQVALVTALVPLALADVITALVASLRMIRRIAEIYGGRSGFLSSWRLTRMVLAHLAATGAVAVGDDLLEHVLGGSVLSKLSRRFGEGLVNGALSARVGLAAMEICRPMPFSPRHKPSTRKVIQAALASLISKGE
ncbi:YcjF family protein [Epibacterium ulvae]|uniref:YcjF family protein n=1 Tax=Epibacterium ulvae TaxID=1156985 RepID=UPI00248FB592|nr:TIGR01620 family protein [Epibacterium ulvae]